MTFSRAWNASPVPKARTEGTDSGGDLDLSRVPASRCPNCNRSSNMPFGVRDDESLAQFECWCGLRWQVRRVAVEPLDPGVLADMLASR